jgi:crotonobetainyl-CoA:carnitine CoA-transferase CaiB-like acyl-CoA transferase
VRQTPGRPPRITVAAIGRADIAINTGGKVLKKPMVEISEAEYDEMIAVNSKSALFCHSSGCWAACIAREPVLRKDAVLRSSDPRAERVKAVHIDIGMLDVQVATLANQAMNYLVSGKVPKRNGNAHPNIQPQDVYACSDGDVILVVGNDGQFAKLCQVFGHPEWVTDERFATNAQRVRHIGELSPLLCDQFAEWERERLIAALDAAGVPCGAINTVAEVFKDQQVKARGMLQHVPHPSGVDVPQVTSPMRFTDSALQTRSAPPLLGQHCDDILSELGYGAADIAALRTAGAI